MIGFGQRLVAALQTRIPMCVGIDPHASLLRDWGLSDDVAGLERFAMTAAESLGPVAAAVKPQAAFFERFGSRGVAVLERTIATCRELGALVIVDAKRGDIGSTAAAYADAFFDPSSPLFCDALTVSPYLGFGSVEPFIDRAAQTGGGLFVLARTSNPEGAQLQTSVRADGRTVGQQIVDCAAELNSGDGVGNIGVVVGATVPPEQLDVRSLNGPILSPGYGVQGATAADVAAWEQGTAVVLASASREILQAGPAEPALVARAREAGSRLSESGMQFGAL